jgi:hypothetical protein
VAAGPDRAGSRTHGGVELMATITCPGCGTESEVEQFHREAGEFCGVCDYPLFWARSTALAVDNGNGSEAGLKRLPGTAGRVLAATLLCPTCTEPNLVTAIICIRCGSDLHPVIEEPTVVLPEPPPPEPEPVVEPVRLPWWLIWSIIAVGVLALIALIVLLLR